MSTVSENAEIYLDVYENVISSKHLKIQTSHCLNDGNRQPKDPRILEN